MFIDHNDTMLVLASGETDWTTIEIPVKKDDKIYISYSKDSSVYEGDDQISFKYSQFVLTDAETVEPTCEHDIVCDICGAFVKAAVEHTYSNSADTSCDVCGAVRVGDINGDGGVNLKDLVTLSRYCANWDVSVSNVDALDVNNDGIVDLEDVTVLARYLAGWDVGLNQ